MTLLPSPFTNKRYLMLLAHFVQNTGGGTGPEEHIRFNGDAGSNYANHNSNNGAIDAVVGNQVVGFFSRTNGFNDKFVVGYIDNNPVGPKYVTGHDNFHVTPLVAYPGAPPDRNESATKWVNAVDPITDIQVGNIIGNIAGCGPGSEAVLLGWSPSDGLTSTANFWQELASSGITQASPTEINVVIPPRRYLWIQCWAKDVNNVVRINLRFNNDSSGYSLRSNLNGAVGGDGTDINETDLNVQSGPTREAYHEHFIINPLNEHKLGIFHGVFNVTLGPGVVPNQNEGTSVYVDSPQITAIKLFDGLGGDWDEAFLKVWGHD